MIVSSASSQSNPRLTGSSASTSTAARHSRGTAIVTYPASARSAAIAVSTGAPVVPGAPPTTSTAPAVNLESRAPRMRHLLQEHRRRAPHRGLDGQEADVGDDDLAGVEAPGATWSPTLLAWNVTVSEALTAAPATSPVDASTPEGRSTETTGSPQALIRSIIAAASGAREHRGSRCRRGRRSPRRSLRRRRSRPPPGPPRGARGPRSARRRRSSRRRRRRRTGARTGYTRIASYATAAPARSIRSGAVAGNPGNASSAARISAAEQSGSYPDPITELSARAARRRRRPPSCGSGSARRRSRACRPARHIPRCDRSASRPASAGRRSRCPST